MKAIWLYGVVMATLMWTSSCDSVSPPPKQPLGSLSSALIAVEGCDALHEAFVQRAVQQMEKSIDTNKEWVLGILRGDQECWMYDEMAAADGNGGGNSDKTGDEASDYSTTNNQVAGVDEADFVKNDGKHIYILAQGKLQIIEAWPAESAQVIASVAIEGTPTKMFVHKDRAVVYSSLDYLDQGQSPFPQGMDWGPDNGFQECTYGYSCDFTGDGKSLKVTVFNIADRTHPELEQETVFTGSLLGARRIENSVYTVVTFPEKITPGVAFWPEELKRFQWDCYFAEPEDNPSAQEVIKAFEELKKSNRELIEKTTIADYLPSVTTTRYDEGQPVKDQALLQECENFYVSSAEDGQRFLSLVSQDLETLGELEATTVLAKPGAIYANERSLYVAVRHYQEHMRGWYFDESADISEATTVHKFGLDPQASGSVYKGSGVVKGRVLNQFSLDEHDSHLRIATTSGHLPNPDAHSTLSILKERNGELVLTGIVDNIAPTEDIRSARFDGKYGFLVTFKKTDPLFVIDLSDPTNPVIKGELKIPGFSTYMHLMDETHLLSIGYDASDQGSFAWFTGIQLQILDVGDVTNPTLLHKEVIGTRGSTSEAATNHLAFNYYKTRDALAIPMVICEGGNENGSYGYNMTFSGLLVYNVTVDNGFVSQGGIRHSEALSGDDYWNTCGNWWTNSNSEVKRSVFMEDYVYSIALDKINIARMDSLEKLIASVDLTAN